MTVRLCRALLTWWAARGWRSVAADPPPLGVQILGLCDYTGVRSVTARNDDIEPRAWSCWYVNHPTHWRHLPAALDLASAPPASTPLHIFTDKR